MTVSLVTGLLLAIGGVNVPWVAKIFDHYSLSVPFCFAFACGLAANNCGKRMVTNTVTICYGTKFHNLNRKPQVFKLTK
jgi:hypothetical protein